MHGGVETVTLKIFAVLMSFDWLANGDFGPFASSVSARYPCPKCMWTASCDCAHFPSDDVRHARMRHHPHCKRRAPRTHAGTMEVVRELRAWKGTKANLKARMTADGIFHLYFPTEHLLRDLVKDATIDTTHIFLCGLSRYLLCWLLDDQIPGEFSWDELNARKKAARFPQDKRVPDLVPTKGYPRSSKHIHLTGAETLHFSLESVEIMEPLVKKKSNPAWLCWKAHVHLLRFCYRKSYRRSTDGPELQRLIKELLTKCEAVTSWGGYEKPKLHLLEHLEEALDDYGPFVGFHCISWGAYVQVLKRMFAMTNYKSAPVSVAKIWAMKAVLHYRDPSRASWYEDEVEPTTDFESDLRSELFAGSELVRVLSAQQPPPRAVRIIALVSRGGVNVRVNDWVLVRRDANGWIGRASEMAEVAQADHRGMTVQVVRIWLRGTKPAVASDDGQLYVSRTESSFAMLVLYESMLVSAVEPVDALIDPLRAQFRHL